MARETALRFTIDINTASLSKLKTAISSLNLGESLGKDLEKQVKFLETTLEGLAQKKISPTASSKELEEYKRTHEQVELVINNINHQLQEQLKLKLQSAGTSEKEIQLLRNKISNNLIDLQSKQNELSVKQELLALDQEIMQKHNETVKKTQESLETEIDKLDKLEKGSVAYDQQLKVIKNIEDALKEHDVITKEHKRRQEEILKVKQEISKIESNIHAQESHLSMLKEGTQAYDDTKQAIEGNKEKLRELHEEKKQTLSTTKEFQKEQIEGMRQSGSLTDKLTDKMKRLAEYTIAAFALRYIRRFFQEGIKFIQDLDKSLTEISTVTGRTRDEMWKMAEEFNRMGRELGKTTNEITQASVIFYRQGLNTNQVLAMVRASTISAAIANTDAGEASNRLTAALRGYNMEAEKAMDIADKLAALAAKSASSFDELSYAMTKTAASAAVAGIDVDHLYAFLAKVIETTRYSIAA